MPLRALEMEERWVVQRWWPLNTAALGEVGAGRRAGHTEPSRPITRVGVEWKAMGGFEPSYMGQ
jgi:hypothetical protein